MDQQHLLCSVVPVAAFQKSFGASVSSLMETQPEIPHRGGASCAHARPGTALALPWRGRSAFTRGRAGHWSSGATQLLTPGAVSQNSVGLQLLRSRTPQTAVHLQLWGQGAQCSARALLLQMSSDAQKQMEQAKDCPRHCCKVLLLEPVQEAWPVSSVLLLLGCGSAGPWPSP